jgi:hypothetical protein
LKSDATNYHLVEPFYIDNGALDGISPEQCFAMGVEWQLFRNRLAHGQAFACLVLDGNAERLIKLAERAGRFAESAPVSDYWTQITVDI